MKASVVDYAIFDDLQGGMKFFHSWKNWIGCQQQFQIKQLYRDPVMLRWGKPCILLSNKDPRQEMDYDDVTWFEGNCSFIEITTPLYYFSCQ